MRRPESPPFAPGASVLGGAAGGLSYEGLMRDAVAREERERRQEAGWGHAVPRIRVQADGPRNDHADQARIAGR